MVAPQATQRQYASIARNQTQRSVQLTTDSIQTQKTGDTFLELPGEIRNHIYTMAIYPDLSSITIVNCAKPEHLAASVLHHPLFRVCRQIRAECLSYVCSKFLLKILGLQTAVVFFSCAEPAISEIKALALVQPAMSILECRGGQENVEYFFAALNKMDALNEVTVEGVGRMSALEQGGKEMEFVRRLENLSRRSLDVKFKFEKERLV